MFTNKTITINTPFGEVRGTAYDGLNKVVFYFDVWRTLHHVACNGMTCHSASLRVLAERKALRQKLSNLAASFGFQPADGESEASPIATFVKA